MHFFFQNSSYYMFIYVGNDSCYVFCLKKIARFLFAISFILIFCFFLRSSVFWIANKLWTDQNWFETDLFPFKKKRKQKSVLKKYNEILILLSKTMNAFPKFWELIFVQPLKNKISNRSNFANFLMDQNNYYVISILW